MAAKSILFLALLGFTAGEESAANPIRKVVTMMQNMQKEIEAEGAKETELYDKFMCFCDGGTADLQKTAADATATNKALTAKYESDTAEKAQLESDIKQHKVDLEAATKDLTDATNIFTKEQADYEAESGTKSASEAALGKAIPAIEKGLGGGASFMQSMDGNGALARQIKRAARSSPVLTDGTRTRLLSFLGGQTPGSSEILGMLKAMKDELSRDLAGMAKANAAAVKGFDSMKASKQKEIEFADESIESKKERSGTLAVEIVQAKDGIEDSASEAAAAEKFAATLIQQCAAKKKAFAVASKARADEIAAIGEAIAILNDDDALDVFKKAIPSAFVQAPEHKNRFSFLQSRQVTIEQVKLAQKSLAGHNLALFSLQTRLRSAERQLQHRGAVDFGAITKMIDEMLAILSQDNKDDLKQKDYCVDQLDQTEAEKASTQDKVDSIASAIEELTDSAAETADELKSLTEAVATLDKDVAEATAMRKKEHEEFSETLKLGEIAVELIGKAKNRLQKFYNPTLYKAPPKTEMTMEEKIISSGKSALMQSEANFDAPDDSDFHGASLLQVAPPEAPEGPSDHKKSAKSGGVMALMDMIVGELKMSNQEASMDEKYAQKEYVSLMADSQDQRGQYSKSIVEKTKMKADLEGQLTEAKQNQALTLQALQNVHDTLGQLHGSCDFLLRNIELRLHARTAEIEGLKSAKAVLAGASFS